MPSLNDIVNKHVIEDAEHPEHLTRLYDKGDKDNYYHDIEEERGAFNYLPEKVKKKIEASENNESEEYKSYKAKGSPRGIDHIGLTVPNMDDAIRFLQEAFNATIVYSMVPKGKVRKGKHVEETLALPKGAQIVRQTLMRLGNGPSLELFQFDNVGQHPSGMLQDFGICHFTIYVDDIFKSVDAVKKAGGVPYYPPHQPAGYEGAKGNWGCYIRPPWGGIVELFSYPSGIKYPDPNKTRWTPPEPVFK